ncbi:MAG: hypothetical protein AAF587_32665 [Bacteroidota bacterium]
MKKNNKLGRPSHLANPAVEAKKLSVNVSPGIISRMKVFLARHDKNTCDNCETEIKTQSHLVEIALEDFLEKHERNE